MIPAAAAAVIQINRTGHRGGLRLSWVNSLLGSHVHSGTHRHLTTGLKMEMTALATTPATALRGRTSDHAAPQRLLQRLEPALLRACRPAGLSAEGLDALAGAALEHTVPAGARVLSRGDAAHDLWLVLDGRVALGMRSGHGELQQRCCVQAGEWLDGASALLQGRYLEDAEAQVPSRLCRLPLAALLDCASLHPEVMPAIATGLAGVLAGLLDATRGLMTKDVTARCATWLLAHAEIDVDTDGLAAPTGSLRLQQRKRAVAQELGTTAETFSRTLAQLSRQGLIAVEGYAIRLLDLAALRRLAEPAR